MAKAPERSRDIYNNLCKTCYGSGRKCSVSAYEPTFTVCPNCKGTGEEPQSRWEYVAAVVMVLIFGVTIFFLHRIK